MPSKNMLPKGKRRQSVKQEYRAARTLVQEQAIAAKARGETPAANEEDDTLLATADFMEHEPTIEERIASNDWFTTRGASGAKVAEETHAEPRYKNPYEHLATSSTTQPELHVIEDLEPEEGVRTVVAEDAAQGMRLDAYLARVLPDISRARVTLLIDSGQVTLDGEAAKGKLKLKGGERIEIEGEPRPEPLHAVAEDIPLSVVYEDDDLAIIDKPAGMMVHAGAGSTEQNRGTLVNALLFYMSKDMSKRMGKGLSSVSGDLRPGIVHRLDKQTSGLIVVAKNDLTHRTLSEMFSERRMRKVYLALVHGTLAEDAGTVSLPIARDVLRRTRMTTRRAGGRHAITHWRVLERIASSYGAFTLVEVRIETGRTHQIRVHMQSLGHPVVGDTLYGAPEFLKQGAARKADPGFALERNFLHAAELSFTHPRTGKTVTAQAPLPAELEAALERLRQPASAAS